MKRREIGARIRLYFRPGWSKRKFSAKELRQLYLIGKRDAHKEAVAVLEDWEAHVLDGDLDEDAMFQVERMIEAVRVLKKDICDGEPGRGKI